MASKELRDGQGNDRETTIARWLREPPESASVVELVLTTWPGGEDPEVSCRWPRERASSSLAPTINGLIEDAANDQGTTINARLAWCTEDGRAYASKSFRAQCSRASEEVVRPMDGTMVATLAQTQRHNEIFVQRTIELTRIVESIVGSNDARFERILCLYERQIERLDQRVTVAEDVVTELQVSEAEAIEVAEEATAQAEQARQEAEAAAADDKLGKFINVAVKQLMPEAGAAS